MLVNPSKPIRKVYVLPIHNAVADNKELYESLRRAWRDIPRIDRYRKFKPEEKIYAVGIIEQNSIISRKIDIWYDDYFAGERMYEFAATPTYQLNPDNIEALEELLYKSWERIIAVCSGYWRCGNYIIVEFDGKDRFRIIVVRLKNKRHTFTS